MTRNEAIIILIKCHSLANRLTIEGLNMELSKEEQEVFKGFCRVWTFGWLDEIGIHEAARLSFSDIDYLTAKMMREVTKYKDI